MKPKLLSGVLAALAVASFAPARAQSVSADGSLGYSYAFPLPPARGKYQPSLFLGYNSNGGATNFGVGWNLSANYIDGVTRATRNNDSSQRTRYFLFMNGAARLLAQAPDLTYRPDVSPVYFSLTKTASGWTGVDGVGNTYTYGCVASTTCSRWYLKSVADVDSNMTYFDYNPTISGVTHAELAETHSCGPNVFETTTALLGHIRYNFGAGSGVNTPVTTVTLYYNPSSNPEVQAVNGCMVTHDLHLSEVDINRVTSGSVVLGSWSLFYQNSPDTRRELLDHIQPGDRSSHFFGLPASFQYETNFDPNTVAGFDAGADFTFSGGDTFGTLATSQCGVWVKNPTACTVPQAATFMDMDGDGLPDLVFGGADPGGAPGVRWARNLGHGDGHPSFSTVSVIPGSEQWAGYVSAINVAGSNPSPAQSSAARAALDATLPPGQHYTYPDQPLGASFIPMGAIPSVPPGTQNPPGPTGTGTIGLVADFDGDGAPDLISSGCVLSPGQAPNPGYLTVSFSRFDSSAPNHRSFLPGVCVDATAPFQAMQMYYSLQQVALSFSEPGPRLFTGSGSTIDTWVQLIDFDGDGVLDFVVARTDVATWYVYPGYRQAAGAPNGAWAFATTPIVVTPHYPWPQNAQASFDIFPIRAVMGAMSGTVFDAAQPPYDISQLMPGKTLIDFRDMNGDGLPDRVVAFEWSDAAGTNDSWFIDYNTGRDFLQLPGPGGVTGLFQKQLPYQDAWVVTRDSALVDLNRDGRPELVIRSSGDSMTNAGQTFCVPSTNENMKVWFNSADGLNGVPTFTEGPCIINPTGQKIIRPFDNYENSDNSTSSRVYNESFTDIDGDGVLDYVRAPDGSEGAPQNHWYFYRAHHQKRRSDILVSMTSSSGLAQTYHWAPSSAYEAKPGLPFVGDVVSAIDRAGPALSPLTVTFFYSGLTSAAVWDDPTGTQQESLGFVVHYETPSVGGLVTQTDFGSTHDTAGLITGTGTGTDLAPWTVSPVGLKETTTTSWASSGIGTNTVFGATYHYPAYIYSSQQIRTRNELAGGAAISEQLSSAPDAFGNITSTTVWPDALPNTSSAPSAVITRVFATGSGSKCPACLVEEVVTQPGSTDELAHSYYHYDLPAGSTSNGRDPTILTTGHLSYVEALASGTGASGQYEIPSLVYYTPSGNIASILKSYSAQQISQLTETIHYDAFDDFSIQSRVLSDGTSTVTTSYSFTSFGDVASVVGPVLSGPILGTGSPPPAMAVYRAYDSAGRLAAESDQAMPAGSVTNPLRAFEYVLATATSPAAIKGYTFSSSPPAFAVGGPVPATDDSTQTITYLDAMGRPVQQRQRLGSGAGPSSTSGNVIKSLPAQYSVRANLLLDGLGRVSAALEPYFSSSGAYVDPRTAAELSTAGLHANVIAYDPESRPTCSVYEPVSGSIIPAPSVSTSCVSNFTEGSGYRRATQAVYGVDSTFDGRPYVTVDTVRSWATQGSTPARIWLDATGRARYSRTPSGTYQAASYDVLGRPVSLVRYPGAPPSSTPTVVNSWTYDKRSRLHTEFADASRYRAYSYLPTGETTQVIQSNNASPTTADSLAVWSVQTIGTLGRIVERDDFRWEVAADCTSSAPHRDATTFQYDLPFSGQAAGRYGYSTGQLTAAMTAATTIAIGYDNHGVPIIRDEWFGSATSPHSVVDTRARDGRLLARAMTSSFLSGYNSAATFGYAIGYDSAGEPVQVNSTYDTAGVFHAIDGTTATRAAAYWLAGTNGTDPATGPFDALGRLSAERWDAGAVSKGRTFLSGSNLPSGYSTTMSSGINVYTVSSMSWQGTLLKGYSLSSNWDGGGTAFAASYDPDGHLQQWSAAPQGGVGSAQQRFAEAYTFSLENLKTVNVTNSLGFSITSTYNYNSADSAEQVTSITAPNDATSDNFVYDRRHRGLVVQHKLNASQAVPQDGYEYDSRNRLISIAHLGTRLESLDYDGVGDLSSRQFPSGSPDVARYYVGDDLTLVDRGGAGNVGYAHIRLGRLRIASLYAKSGATPSLIYYHRDRRNDVVATTTSGGHMGLSYRYLPSGAVDKVLDANGNPGTETDTVRSELGFIGGLKLSGGLVHLRARAYSPALRRFLQPDTLDFRRYTYAGGDALNQIDPNGRAGGPDEDDEREHADDPGDEGGVPGDGQRPDGGGEEITVNCCRQPQQAAPTVTMGDLIGQTPDQAGPTLVPGTPDSSGIYAPGNTYGPNLSSMIGGSTEVTSPASSTSAPGQGNHLTGGKAVLATLTLAAAGVGLGCVLTGCAANAVGALIGGATSFVGTLAGQRLAGKSFDFAAAFAAAGVGAVAGLASPFVNPIILNAAAGLATYVGTADEVTFGGALTATVLGGLAGRVAGAMVPAGQAEANAFLSGRFYSTFLSANSSDTAQAALGTASLLRSMAGGFIGGLDTDQVMAKVNRVGQLF